MSSEAMATVPKIPRFSGPQFSFNEFRISAGRYSFVNRLLRHEAVTAPFGIRYTWEYQRELFFSSFKPLLEIYGEVREFNSPYKTIAHRDLNGIQPLRGLFHGSCLILGTLFAGALLLSPFTWLLWSPLKDTHFLKPLECLGKILFSLNTVLKGIYQILSTPLMWFFIIPYRQYLTTKAKDEGIPLKRSHPFEKIVEDHFAEKGVALGPHFTWQQIITLNFLLQRAKQTTPQHSYEITSGEAQYILEKILSNEPIDTFNCRDKTISRLSQRGRVALQTLTLKIHCLSIPEETKKLMKFLINTHLAPQIVEAPYSEEDAQQSKKISEALDHLDHLTANFSF